MSTPDDLIEQEAKTYSRASTPDLITSIDNRRQEADDTSRESTPDLVIPRGSDCTKFDVERDFKSGTDLDLLKSTPNLHVQNQSLKADEYKEVLGSPSRHLDRSAMSTPDNVIGQEVENDSRGSTPDLVIPIDHSSILQEAENGPTIEKNVDNSIDIKYDKFLNVEDITENKVREPNQCSELSIKKVHSRESTADLNTNAEEIDLKCGINSRESMSDLKASTKQEFIPDKENLVLDSNKEESDKCINDNCIFEMVTQKLEASSNISFNGNLINPTFSNQINEKGGRSTLTVQNKEKTPDIFNQPTQQLEPNLDLFSKGTQVLDVSSIDDKSEANISGNETTQNLYLGPTQKLEDSTCDDLKQERVNVCDDSHIFTMATQKLDLTGNVSGFIENNFCTPKLRSNKKKFTKKDKSNISDKFADMSEIFIQPTQVLEEQSSKII